MPNGSATAEVARQDHRAQLEFGIDRSNMATEWTLAPPHEPNIAPFLIADYNKPGDFEARRVAVMDGIAKTHVQWFRDGFGGSEQSIDLLRLVHARGMKMLAIVGHAASDYPAGANLNKAQSGCQWGTYPLSKIDIAAYQKRIEGKLEAASVSSIRKYFPQAPIITYGNSLPAAAPLIEALASVAGPDGKLTDYTKLVDGYGAHLYPTSDTTQDMVQDATAALRGDAAHYPHLDQKSTWITEWNPSSSSWWNGRPWYFQYDAHGQPGGELNKAGGAYPAMDRAGVIRAFNQDVVEKLRVAAPSVNISHVLFYDYDSGGSSPKCAHVKYGWNPTLANRCADGVIDPSTGKLLIDVAAAVAGAAR
jgi:hypothetical protein